jgi:hypothetical protein
LTADEGQPFVLGEVGKVLDVESCKRKVIDKAAGGYPAVVLRARPSASLRASLKLTPFVRHRFVVRQDFDPLTPGNEGNTHRVTGKSCPQLVGQTMAQAE